MILESEEFHMMLPGGWLGATPEYRQHCVTEEHRLPEAALPVPPSANQLSATIAQPAQES